MSKPPGVPTLSRRFRVARVVLCLGLISCGTPVLAATAVKAWETTYMSPNPGNVGPLAGKQLADASTMIVAYDGASLSARRYDGNGNLISAVPFYPTYRVTRAEIGPFGEVAVLAVTVDCGGGCSGGNLWLMKYDGLTGRALWSRPAVYGSAQFSGDVPTALVLAASGDVVAEVSLYGNVSILKYDGRTGAPKFAPILFQAGTMGGITTDAAGNVVASYSDLAENANFETSKYDGETGALLWGPITYDSGENFDYPRLVAADATGVVVVGTSVQNNYFGLSMLKYDLATGAKLWGPIRYVDPTGLTDVAQIILDDAHDVLLCIGVNQAGGAAGYSAVRFDGATGALVWGPAFLCAGTSFLAPHLALAGNGDIIADDVEFSGNQPIVMVRRIRGDDGTLVWGPTSDGPTPFVRTVVLTSEGQLVIEYLFDNGSYPYPDVVTARSSDDGATVWTATPAFTGAAHGLSKGQVLTATPDGNVVAAGEEELASGPGVVLAKYDAATGGSIWGPVEWGGNWYTSPVAMAADAAGDVLVLSWYFGNGNGVVLKFSGSSGALLWTSPMLAGVPIAMAVDAAGNAAVVSRTGGSPGPGSDFSTVRVSGASGALLWGPIAFDGGGGFDDFPDAIATLPSGDVVVAGRANAGSGGRAAVIAYSAATGSVLWGPVIEPQIYDPGMRLAADAAGNVVLAGGGMVMSTIEYSGATGSVLWGPEEQSVGIGGTDAHAVAIDGNGDVIVSGAFPTAFNQSEFATLKYAGTDGTLLWGPVTYQGPGAGPDQPYAAAVDGSGNAVVSGVSRNADGLRDVVTLEYDGASGNLLWGPVSTFTGADQDFGGLAVAASRRFVGTNAPEGMVTTAYTEALGVQTIASEVPAAVCGQSYTFSFVAVNGTAPYAWSVTLGTPPPGIDLAPDGTLSGTPTGEGSFDFRVHVQDAASATADLDVTVRAVDAGGIAAVLVAASPASLCAWRLSVPGDFVSYQWLPGGETSPTIDVSPSEPTTYAAVVTDATGCLVHAAVTIPAPRCTSPSVTSISPRWGPSAGGAPVTVAGHGFDAGAAFSIGDVAASGVVVVSSTEITGSTPPLAPGGLYDVRVTNSSALESVLPQAFMADFGDVPSDNMFHDDVARIMLAGITAGCGGGNYCPQSSVTRAQMAVFLLKAMLGTSYSPPAATGTVFQDVPSGAFAADWIEDLYARGITGGCSASPLLYCPDQPVTRAQMAVFLLKAEHTSAYVPPACTGVFGDVPCPGGFAVDWIEQLSVEGVTAGCGGGNYCPSQPNTRGQMAVFLVKTFDVP